MYVLQPEADDNHTPEIYRERYASQKQVGRGLNPMENEFEFIVEPVINDEDEAWLDKQAEALEWILDNPYGGVKPVAGARKMRILLFFKTVCIMNYLYFHDVNLA